jgi:hypothetical protein
VSRSDTDRGRASAVGAGTSEPDDSAAASSVVAIVVTMIPRPRSWATTASLESADVSASISCPAAVRPFQWNLGIGR